MNSDLGDRLRAGAQKTLAGRPVLFAYLFGSRVAGRPRPDSDVDVAVYFDPSAEEDVFGLHLRLGSQLEKESGVHPIDMIILNEAPLPVAGRVVSEGVVIYSADEPARVRYEGRLLKLYLDDRIHADDLAKAYLRGVAEGRA